MKKDKARCIIALLLAFALIVQYGISFNVLTAYADDHATTVNEEQAGADGTQEASSGSVDVAEEKISVPDKPAAAKESAASEGQSADAPQSNDMPAAEADKASEEQKTEDSAASSDTDAEKSADSAAADSADSGDTTSADAADAVDPSAETPADEASETADPENDPQEEPAQDPNEDGESKSDDIVQTVSAGGATITAKYNAEAFDDEVEFKADVLRGKKRSIAAINELVGQENTASVLYAFDLYFVTGGGERLEPTDDVRISIEFSKPQNKGVPGELRVVHIDDKGKAEYIDNASVSKDASSTEFTNDQFSEYDVIAESGSIIEVSTKEEVQAVITDLNTNGGFKAIKLMNDIALANTNPQINKGELTILGEGHILTVSISVRGEGKLNLGIDGYDKTLDMPPGRSDLCVVNVDGRGELNIYNGVTIRDCTRYGQPGGIMAIDSSIVNMYGGTITNCSSYAVSGGIYLDGHSVFNMHGGEITNCTGVNGGAIGLSGGSAFGPSTAGPVSFNMYGGTISNCTDNYMGGGAVCSFSSYPLAVNIYGGKIENCKAKANSSYAYGGGAIYLFCWSNLTFNMEGGEITDSSCSDSKYGFGGAVLIYATGSGTDIQFKGGKITRNSAKIGGGLFLYNGNATIADGFSMHNNTASTVGNDIYNNENSVTLGKADTNATLDSTGMKITGWYYDGTRDEDGGAGRWSWSADSTDTNYVKEFSHAGETYAGEYALVAAHGDPVYKVTFDPDGGTPDPDDQEVKHNETALKPAPDPTKTGYTFKGWYKVVDGAMQETEFDFTTKITGNTDLKAKYEPVTYKIEYDLDGGALEAGKSNPESYTIESDNITLNNPVRKGYTFKGWTGTDLDAATATVTIAKGSTGDREYTAQWELNEYTITYDLAGGSLAEGKSNPASYTAETDTFTLNNPVREGYTFKGWTGTDLGAATETVTIAKGSTGNREYTAIWEANKYVVKFDANKGSGTMDDESFEYDEKKALTANAFTRAGYTFTGWKTAADGSGTAYADNATVKNLTAEDGGVITLYAQWTADGSKLTYNGNSGEGSMDETVGKTDQVVKVAANGFTRTGYTFKEWNTAADGSGDRYAPGADFTLTAETTVLYAQWTPNQYTITFDTAGGSAIGPITQDFGTAVTAPADPTREGYTFDGWDKDIPSTMPAENQTITAKWRANQYVVKFDANKGSGSMDDESFEYDEEKALTANAFSRAGYTFTGWNTAADGSGTAYADNATVKNLTARDSGVVTLYAQWTADGSKLTYNANGGEGSTPETTGKTDETVKVAENGFTRTGYTFTGWNTAADGSGDRYAPGADFTLAAEPTVLYAQWDANRYTITFNTAGGNAIDPITQAYGTDVTAPANPTRRGYTFAGWDTEIPSTMPAGDMTITARWTRNAEPAAPTVDDDDDDNTPAPTRRRRPAATPATPAAPAAPAAPTGIVADTPVPQAEPQTEPADEPEIIEEPEVPTTDTTEEGKWALLNLIGAIITAAGACLALSFGRRKDDEDDDDNAGDNSGRLGYSGDTDDEDDDDKNRRRINLLKLIGILAAIASIIAFILTEDMSLPMGLIDRWTILTVILLAIQIACAIGIKRALKDDDSEDEEAEGADA